MYGEWGGFSNLSSIDFSGLSSLTSVGEYWMYGYNGGFQNMKYIYVGNIAWKEGFSITGFCDSWPTGTGKTIYGDEATSWKVGGISDWTPES